MKKLIVVADWAADSLACQEVRTATEGFLEDPSAPNISFVSSTPNTIHSGFLISQIAETEERYGRPLDTVLFQNTDPMQEHTEEVGGIGAELFIVRLKSGLHVLGPNAGNVFSFLKPKIDEIFHYKDLETSGYFRSRDVFPKIAAYFMDSLQDDLELDEVHSNLVPELDGYYIGHIDSFGNIMTTIPESVLKGKYSLGSQLNISINGNSQKATFVKSLFDGNPDSLIIYPGSSGTVNDPYLELSICTDFSENHPNTGVHLFNNPKAGVKIEIE